MLVAVGIRGGIGGVDKSGDVGWGGVIWVVDG